MKKFEWTDSEISKCIVVSNDNGGETAKCWIMNYVAIDNENPNQESDEYGCTKILRGIYSTKEKALETFKKQKLYEKVRDALIDFKADCIDVEYYLDEDNGMIEDDDLREELSEMDEGDAAIEIVKMFSLEELRENGMDWDDPYYNYYYELEPFYGDVEL